MSTTVADGMAQEVVMDPSITTGTRKGLTDLDLAFLQDIGWSVIPEPSRVMLLVFGFGLLVMARRRAA